MSIVYPHKSSL